jgi:ATP-dependent protease ClpP protease subunit
MKKLLIALALLLPSFGLAQPLAPVQIGLTTANTVTFRGEVDGMSTSRVMLALIELVKVRGSSQYPIYLVLDSPGGDIETGGAFIEFVRTIPNVHTITIFGASMAAGIMQGLPGKRYVTDTGGVMFHRARGSMSGQFEDGELESRLDFFKKVVRNMEQVNASRIGITLADYKAKVINEWWIYGAEAVQQKVADAVAVIKCSPQLIEKESVEDIQSMFGSISVAFSGCPLIRVPIRVENQ